MLLHGLSIFMLPQHYRSLSISQIHSDMSKHYQDLCSKYLARRRRLSLPPSLPSSLSPSLPSGSSSVSTSTHWQKAMAFLKRNLKFQRAHRSQPDKGGQHGGMFFLIYSCKVKAASCLSDSFPLIKGLIIPNLPNQLYPYAHLLGYFIHKALNKLLFYFFAPTF